MATKQRRKSAAAAEDERTSGEEKIARLLGLLLVKDIEKKTNKVPMLRRAGFSVSEVAALLDMEENHVRVADHQGRKKKTKA